MQLVLIICLQHEKAVDVRLRPGESKEYSFQEKIPPDAPPSYSGGFVKVGITQPTHNLVTKPYFSIVIK